MTKILKILTLFLFSLTLFMNYWTINTYALWGWTDTWISYCKWNSCWIDKWIKLVKWWVKEIKTEWTASDYIQWIVKRLLKYITLIAIIFIIYSWFRILTSSGEDETIKNAKKTIIYVVVWILVIWFAWAIANFAVTLWASWK